VAPIFLEKTVFGVHRERKRGFLYTRRISIATVEEEEEEEEEEEARPERISQERNDSRFKTILFVGSTRTSEGKCLDRFS
jgi:hypothetical protein